MIALHRRAAFSASITLLVVAACSDSPEVPDASSDATTEGSVDAKSEAAADVTTDVPQDVHDEPPQDATTADATDAQTDSQGDASQSDADAAEDAGADDAPSDASDDADAGGCLSSSACTIGYYCEENTCGAVGSCLLRPAFCPSIVAPVCGCDNVTYNNSCLAHRVGGVTVAYNGNCE